jgi:hypothetical protein
LFYRVLFESKSISKAALFLIMDEKIVLADKKFRKQFIVFLILIIVVFVVLIVNLKSYLDQAVQQSRESQDMLFRKTIFLLKWWMGLGALPILGFWVYQIFLARRILKSGQFPPPGMRVIRDTMIQTGTRAKKTAIIMIAISSIILAIMLFLVYFPYALEKRLLEKKTIYLKDCASFRGCFDIMMSDRDSI